MSKHKLEYIWLDGYKPTQSLRSKTMIVDDFSGNLSDAKQWSFDGSSTEQAETKQDDKQKETSAKPQAAAPRYHTIIT